MVQQLRANQKKKFLCYRILWSKRAWLQEKKTKRTLSKLLCNCSCKKAQGVILFQLWSADLSIFSYISFLKQSFIQIISSIPSLWLICGFPLLFIPLHSSLIIPSHFPLPCTLKRAQSAHSPHFFIAPTCWQEETGEDAALYLRCVLVTSLATARCFCLWVRLGSVRHFQLLALEGLKRGGAGDSQGKRGDQDFTRQRP